MQKEIITGRANAIIVHVIMHVQMY